MSCAFCGFDPAGPFARGRKLADRGGRVFCAAGDCEALEAARAQVPPFGATVDVIEVDGVWRWSMEEGTSMKVGEVKDADPVAVLRHHLEMGSVIPHDVARAVVQDRDGYKMATEELVEQLANARAEIDRLRAVAPLHDMLSNDVVAQLVAQLRLAIKYHPESPATRYGRFPALVEEVGEVAKDMQDDNRLGAFVEAVQVAVCALRFAQDVMRDEELKR